MLLAVPHGGQKADFSPPHTSLVIESPDLVSLHPGLVGYMAPTPRDTWGDVPWWKEDLEGNVSLSLLWGTLGAPVLCYGCWLTGVP